MSQFWLYFKLGLYHVLDWHAYDHILFLIVLVVGYTFNDWRKVLWLVTLFTLGHSLSLLLSVFNVVSVNSTLVEFLIPITIGLTALFNVFTAGKGARREKLGLLYFATLFFGIIHGFGFSYYFKNIVTGSNTGKLLPLAEFALGIEAAQIIVVLVVLILGFIFQTIFRFSKRDWMLVISSIVIGMIIPMIFSNYPW